MADTDITLFYNTHRLSALEHVLKEKGLSLKPQLLRELDDLYTEFVPENERERIEAEIARENAEEEAARRFAVIHFHDDSDDFHFTTKLRNDFYSVAHLYRKCLKDEVGKFTLDSLARHFGEHQMIDDLTFSVLCDAMPDDQRITALIDFDFERGMVSVCEGSDNAWWTYDLKDVSTAVYRADRKSGLSLETQREIFNEALAGKEIDMDSESEDIEESGSPTMQL